MVKFKNLFVFVGWLFGSVLIGDAIATVLPAHTKRSLTSVILVDKKTNLLHVARYVNGHYEKIKTFHTTLGQVKGDKEEEGDLKTPEGIYTFKSKLLPPKLQAKFGVMAFYLNYPNTYDELAGRTGSDIMLHATNEPERLKQDYDSQGCVVVKNEELIEIQSYIRLGLTPVLIFSELPESQGSKDSYLTPGAHQGLKDFFNSWVGSWETKSIDRYIWHYHTDFSAQGKNRDQWKAYKASLNSRYQNIQIGPEEVHYYRHPKYSMVTFTQNYFSTLKGGGVGHRSRGTKILYVAEEGGIPKIIAESYTTLMW